MFTTRPEILGTYGVASSTHWLASSVAMKMLEAGGNAFDAAVAAGMTLQVCEPHLNGPGGDMPALIYRADQRKSQVICGQGVAPDGATIAHYKGLGLDMVPGSGLLATVVPGAFDAWMLMLRDHGTMTLEQIFEPAISYAINGVPVVPRITDTVNTVRELFETEWPTSAALFLPNGRPPVPGTLFYNPTMAATWQRLIAEGKAAGGSREAQIDATRNAWYEGFVAEAMDKFCRENEVMDVSGRRHSGVLTGDDMAKWRASYDEPQTYDFRGYTVMKTGPWGQGPVLLQQLALLKEYGLKAMDPTGPDFVHVAVEAAKLAFADREAFYGDPNFVETPMDTLLSDDYNRARRELIDMDRASLEFRPGEIEGYGGAVDYAAHVAAAGDDKYAKFGIGEPTVGKQSQVRGDTCHVDVIDRHGNMVACMPSGGWLQSSPTIPELGFCLNSRAQMFWLEEDRPATLVPGKRPRTTLSPSMALKDGEPYMVFGTPGGDQQDQWQVNVFLRHTQFGMNLQEAIDAPSWHSEHFPNSFFPRPAKPGRLVLEGRFPQATIDELKRRGHDVEVGDDWSEGRMCAAAQENGILKAGSNPRGMQGYAVGR
ncbi:MAG: gamma-glutamyltransferase family protein, partial [Alphaproteobacteria bacterium]|nr:gamma-glutamyltransferase family protein [Alphaproteobacteria bacterium]